MPWKKGQAKTPGSGRKPGVRNKRTRELVEACAKEGITALEYLLAVMRDTKADPDRRDRAAVAAAPFLHPKLSATTLKADQNSGGIKVVIQRFADSAPGHAAEKELVCERLRPQVQRCARASVVSRWSLRRSAIRLGSSRSMPGLHLQRLPRGTPCGCNGCAPSRIPRRSGSSSATSPASKSGRKCSGFATAYVGDRKIEAAMGTAPRNEDFRRLNATKTLPGSPTRTVCNHLSR
jgi:hypothetical protein